MSSTRCRPTSATPSPRTPDENPHGGGLPVLPDGLAFLGEPLGRVGRPRPGRDGLGDRAAQAVQRRPRLGALLTSLPRFRQRRLGLSSLDTLFVAGEAVGGRQRRAAEVALSSALGERRSLGRGGGAVVRLPSRSTPAGCWVPRVAGGSRAAAAPTV